MKINFLKCDVSKVAICLLALTAAPVQAQDAPAAADDDGLGIITVTAQRRSENLQSVPVAVTVTDGARFDRAGSFDPVDLGRVATGLFANSFNGDRSNIIYTIRGQAMTTGTLFPAVVPYFAEVPLNKLLVGTFFDLENVQTLRGPQGTLFGRVTDGGAVLIQPRRPSDKLEGYVQAKVGNYDLRGFSGALNIPIVEGKIAFRGATEIVRRDGFTTNLYDNSKLDGAHYESYRGSLLLTPFDGFENYTVVNYTHANETGGSAQIYVFNRPAFLAVSRSAALADRMEQALSTQQQIGPRNTYNDSAHYDRRQQLVVSNSTKVDIADNVSAKLVLGYIFLKQITANDYDGTALPISNQIDIVPSPTSYQRHLSGELQFQGNLLDDRLDWTIGGYLDRQKTPGLAEDLSVSFGASYRGSVQNIRTTSTAGYAQLGFKIIPSVKAIGGVRRTHDTVDAFSAIWSAPLASGINAIPHGQCLTTRPATVSASSVPCLYSSAKFNETTWIGGLEWTIDRNLFAYAKISKGYRPGGFNSQTVAAKYDPESVVSKEVGIKADLKIAGMPLRVNIAGFYDDFRDIQRLVTLIDPVTGPGAANINTKSAVVKGIEFESTMKPLRDLELGFRWTYLDAGYNIDDYTPEYIAAACPADPRTQATDPTKYCPYNPFGRTPKFTVGLNARYTVDIGLGQLSFGGDWFYTDSQYVVTTGYITPEVKIPSYNVLNLDISFENIGGLPVDLSIFGTNVLDKTYISSVSAVSQMGSSGYANYSFGAPRMYGASLRYRFGS